VEVSGASGEGEALEEELGGGGVRREWDKELKARGLLHLAGAEGEHGGPQ